MTSNLDGSEKYLDETPFPFSSHSSVTVLVTNYMLFKVKEVVLTSIS